MRLKGGFKSIRLAFHLSPSDRFRSMGNSANIGLASSRPNSHGHFRGDDGPL